MLDILNLCSVCFTSFYTAIHWSPEKWYSKWCCKQWYSSSVFQYGTQSNNVISSLILSRLQSVHTSRVILLVACPIKYCTVLMFIPRVINNNGIIGPIYVLQCQSGNLTNSKTGFNHKDECAIVFLVSWAIFLEMKECFLLIGDYSVYLHWYKPSLRSLSPVWSTQPLLPFCWWTNGSLLCIFLIL